MPCTLNTGESHVPLKDTILPLINVALTNGVDVPCNVTLSGSVNVTLVFCKP